MNTIGRYQLVEKLGQGGMGVVYRAFDTLLHRVVAVKLISGSIEAGAEQRERFFREARSAGQLSHRNIITIHDLGEHEGQPYLAMEFLEGEDLQHRLTRAERMSLARKVELAIEICEGLEYAHSRGVIHRDIKPANIFITENGTAKILDFGLARLVTSELTNSNMMMGTMNYMAPEQVRGERADHRSDVFSVGVVLYELLGGRKAFEGDSFAATIYKILQEEPLSLLSIEPTLPPDLAAIVDRALAKPRDERYQHMSEMLRDLAVYRQQMIAFDSPALGRPASGARSRSSSPSQPWVPLDPGSDAPTIAHPATPPSEPVRPPGGTSPPTTPVAAKTAPPVDVRIDSGQQPVLRSRVIWIAAAVALILIAALAMWATRSPQPAPAETAVTPEAGPTVDTVAVATGLRQATQSLEAGDLAEAQRHADAVLALAPNHAEARRLRERAVATLESVTSGLREAREHYKAGRFDEASRAAGNVLSVAPGQQEARQLMQDATARSRGRGVDEARARMNQAKAAARSASAASLAPVPYNVAVGSERSAERLRDAGKLADATARFYEASGLFRSAELAAQSEASAREERAEAARAEKARAEAATVEPQPSLPPTRGVESLPAEATKLPTPPPIAPAAPPQPAPPPAATAPSDQSLIADLLSRYEAALETRSLGALKRLWPGLSGDQESAIRNEFQHAKRIDVEIASPRIDVTGETATASFTRRYELLTTDGQRLASQSVATMALRRTAAGWIIDRVRFDPVR